MISSMLSAVIITLNEEKNIRRCLESIRDVVDEIIIVDSGSKDATVAICREFDAKVIATEWKGYAATKNFGNEKAAGEQILSLDADEALSPQLAASIQKVKGERSAFYFNRLTSYCGRWIYHCGWYPDAKVRLFPKGKARWEGKFVHEKLVLDQDLKEKHLAGDLLHYSYHTVEEHRQRIESYSTLHAKAMKAEGNHPSCFKLLFAPTFKFFKTYFLQLGLLDGKEGLLISYYSAKAVCLKIRKARG